LSVYEYSIVAEPWKLDCMQRYAAVATRAGSKGGMARLRGCAQRRGFGP